VKTVNDKQYGGDHYKKYGNLQPWDVVLAWKLGYLEGTALKYIARWRDKGGIEDIRKAIHFLEKLVEVETQHEKVSRTDDLGNQLRRAFGSGGGSLSGSQSSATNVRGPTLADQPPRTTGYARLSEGQVSALCELAQQYHFGDYGNVLVSPVAGALGGFRRVYPVDEQTGDSFPTDGLLNDSSGFDALHMRE